MSDLGQGGGGLGPPGSGGFGPPQGAPPPGGGFGPGGAAPPGGGGFGGPPQGYFQPGAGYFADMRDRGYQPTEYEKEQAFNVHLLAALGAFLCCGTVLGAVAPLLIHATAKEKGPFLLYHINQAAIFQAAFFAINTAISILGGALSIVCIGYAILMLLPFTWLIATIFPIVVAFGAKRGEWNDYPWVGPKVMREWKPLFS